MACNIEGFASGDQKNMRVIVRVCPNNRREVEESRLIKVIDSSTLLFDPDEDYEFFFQGVTKRVKNLTMEFDKVFYGEATNFDIFKDCIKPLVDSAMNGYNCSVFAYGAGKTLTMQGNEQIPGIRLLTMLDLFHKIRPQTATRKFDIGISYLEVYNEQVMNLLTKTGPLKLREDSNGVVVSGLVLKPIKDIEELIYFLELGNKNRTQHLPDAYYQNSRGHAIFQAHIRMTEENTGQKRIGKLSMIELAGSERSASTKGHGVRFKEGVSINKSLFALRNCINKLADGCSHIPYRESLLTRILKDSLGGNCQTVMIANISPSSLTYEETYNTLKFASRAKKNRTLLPQNIMSTNMPKEYYFKKVSKLMDENKRLRATNNQLEAKVSTIRGSSDPDFHEFELKSWYRKIDAVYSVLIQSQENYCGLGSKKILLKCTAAADGFNADMEMALFVRYAEEIEKQKQGFSVWKNRYNESVNDLDKLRNEIKNIKYSEILEMYMKEKDAEVQVSQQRIKAENIKKILTLLVPETSFLSLYAWNAIMGLFEMKK